jgi:hypothetical protein
MSFMGAKPDPLSGLDLKGRILQRIRSVGVDRQVLDLVQTACESALKAEGVVLRWVEKKRLVAEVFRSLSAEL